MPDWVKFPDADSYRDLFFRKSAVGAVAPVIGGLPAKTEIVVSGVRFRLRTDTQQVLRSILDAGAVPLAVDEVGEDAGE